MSELAALDGHGVLSEPTTLRIERLLPGPIERVWAYLTDEGLRRRWLAAGEMVLEVGAPFELVWRNGELPGPAGERPEGMPEEHRMQSRITELDPPRRIAFTWDKVTPGQGNMELYLADSDGENAEPFFTENKLSHEEWASWSPDSQWIACTSTRDDNVELYLCKVDGTEKQRLTSDPAIDAHPSFSPDGTQIAFATNRWGDMEIAVYNLNTDYSIAGEAWSVGVSFDHDESSDVSSDSIALQVKAELEGSHSLR